MKKILIMYARYGSGHKSIAECVYNYIKEHNKDIEIKLLDMTDYANRFGKITVKLMDYTCHHRTEKLFDFCYRLLNHRFLTFYNNSIAKKSYDNERLRREIKKFNPDVTISSHFFCSNIIHHYNQINLINSKIVTIITDYTYHEFWIKNYKTETAFIVANNVVKQELVRRGVDNRKIYAFGLPLNINKVNDLEDKEIILKRYNLTGAKKIYLFFGGSTAGSMYYYDYFRAIAKMNLKADIIFVSGKNAALKQKCEQYVKNNDIPNIKVLGYTNDVLNLLNISDLIISKPGGATVTECLEMHKPMLLVPGIGGQEKYNAFFVVKNGYGMKVRGIWSFKRKLNKFEYYPNMLTKMKQKLENQAENKSAKKINDLVMKL